MENETNKIIEVANKGIGHASLSVQELIAESSNLVLKYALSVAGAVLLLVVGLTLAGLVSRWARKTLLGFRHIDITLASFLANLIKYAIWVLVAVMVLGQFGVQTTSIIAVLGAAGLAVGLALQGTLANIAAGIMLLVLRPFRVGEYIDTGSVNGTVQEIGLFTTELKLPNGLFVMAPNSSIWNEPITNYSRNPTRRIEFTVGIGYGDDTGQARRELLELVNSDDRVLADPEPVTFVNSLDDSSVGVGLWCWTKAPDYLATARDLTERAKARFDQVGISIPYPQREVTQYVIDARREARPAEGPPVETKS